MPHSLIMERKKPICIMEKDPLNSALSHTRYFFNKENKVRKRAEFLHAYAKTQPVKRRGVAVFVLNRGEEPPLPTRLGITATKKTIGDAHKRNRLRRVVREIFRLSLPQFKPGHTVIVNMTRASLEMNYEQLRRSLHSVWRETGLFQELPEPVVVPEKVEIDPGHSAFAKVLYVIESPFRLAVLGTVKLYRLIISPIMPPICRFHPSCSAYGLECLQTLPFHRALPLMIWRILRCNPLCRGGYDPVPNGRHSQCPGEDSVPKPKQLPKKL